MNEETKDLSKFVKIEDLKKFVDVFLEIRDCKELVSYEYTKYNKTNLLGRFYGRKISIVIKTEEDFTKTSSSSYVSEYGDDIIFDLLDEMNITVESMVNTGNIKTPEKEDIRDPDYIKNFKLDRGLM